MPNNMQHNETRGGSHEQQGKAGQQAHKADENRNGDQNGASNRGGTHEQHVKAGQQSHKNDH